MPCWQIQKYVHSYVAGCIVIKDCQNIFSAWYFSRFVVFASCNIRKIEQHVLRLLAQNRSSTSINSSTFPSIPYAPSPRWCLRNKIIKFSVHKILSNCAKLRNSSSIYFFLNESFSLWSCLGVWCDEAKFFRVRPVVRQQLRTPKQPSIKENLIGKGSF